MNFKRVSNEVLIVLLTITGILMTVSFIFMMGGIKKLSAIHSNVQSIPALTPTLSVQRNDYTQEQYAKIKGAMGADAVVMIDAKPDRLVISVSSVNDELRWRHAVSDTLALDKDLHAVRVCGSIASACSGVALVAEIIGYRQQVLVQEGV